MRVGHQHPLDHVRHTGGRRVVEPGWHARVAWRSSFLLLPAAVLVPQLLLLSDGVLDVEAQSVVGSCSQGCSSILGVLGVLYQVLKFS